jgi:hypothetical protein
MPPVNTYKQGAVGTADRVANFQPESWSPTVHKALPYNRFPMTTIMDAMAKGSGTIDSRFHHWSEEAHTPYYGTILDVYTDVLSTAYVSGGVEGTPIYIAVTAAEAAQVRGSDDILITNDANNSVRVVRINNVVVNGDTTSYHAGTLAETDTGNLLARADLHWALMSDAQSENSELPVATSHDGQWYDNVTQIIMESVEMTGSEMSEKQRINENKWTHDQKQAYVKLKMKEEWANLFGVYKIGTGSNGKRKSYMRGARTAIATNDSANILDWRTSSGYSGAWINSGLNWLDEVLNDASVYTDKIVRTGFIGNAAWFGINQAVRNAGTYQIEVKENGYGIQIATLYGLTTTLKLIMSPSMTTRGWANSMFLTDMDLIRKKTFRPLMYVKDLNKAVGGHSWVDGKKEGWVQETTQEIVNTRCMRWIDGIGLAHN